jgi:Transposase DDE domain.
VLAGHIKDIFHSSVSTVARDISQYTLNPGRDLVRNRKIPADKLIAFLVSEGSASTKNELLDFFGMNPSTLPTASAFNQQRAKLKPDAFEAVFKSFNTNTAALENSNGYRCLAADGSTSTFFSNPRFAPDEYFVSEGHSMKGFYSMHLNALFDLERHVYTDAVIQPVHCSDEFKAFCYMVDHHDYLPDSKNIFIGDRGYCSYNNMAHVINKNQFFIFRTKDINRKGLVGAFDFPNHDSFDSLVKVTLVRSQSVKLTIDDGYKRFVDKATSFDFIDYGSSDKYELSFRVVRFPLSEGSFECIVTNLPADEFPPERIKSLYNSRWGIESSFRKLKYTIGLSNLHSLKPDYVKQEIWARLIAYNITETIINSVVVSKNDTMLTYQVNFSVAAHICRVFLRLCNENCIMDVSSLLQRELIPVRDNRHFPRLQTAHFRKPRYFLYRAA